MNFPVDRSRLVAAAHQLRHYTTLVVALLPWLFSLQVLRWSLRNEMSSPPCSTHPNSAAVPAKRLIKGSLRVSTYGEVVVARGAADETCAVCLCQLRRRDRVRVPRNCCHLYHRRCLDRWIDHDRQGTCPLCRAPLLGSLLAPDPSSSPPPQARPSWAVEQLLYLFEDDLPRAAPSSLSSSSFYSD